MEPLVLASILRNPKYPGFMVWNRRASKTGGGRHNPASEWLWSPMPTHEPLVPLELFRGALDLAPARQGSRSESGANRYPQTRRTYLLRSYVLCGLCGRRMHGKTRKGIAYFSCQPSLNHGHEAGARFPGHPPSVYVRQDALVEGVLDFLDTRVLGTDRLATSHTERQASDVELERSSRKRIDSIRAAVTELEARKRRLIEQMERDDDPDGLLFRELRSRVSELVSKRDGQAVRTRRGRGGSAIDTNR